MTSSIDGPRIPRLSPTASASDRAAHVAHLKATISEDRYDIPAEEVAQAILAFHVGSVARGGEPPI